MKIKLKNNNALSSVQLNRKTEISGVLIENCQGMDAFNLCNSILSTSGNTLGRIRLDLGNVTKETNYATLEKYLGKGGYDGSGSDSPKPVIIASSINIGEWILETEEQTLREGLSISSLVTPHVAYDSEGGQTNSLHFKEIVPPSITLKTFDFSEYSKIYVGLGNSYWEDYGILEAYKESWPELENKLDTWWNYLNNRDIDTSVYAPVPWIMTDRVNILDTQISDATSLMVDCAYILIPTNEVVVNGNRNTGFKGNSEGIYVDDVELLSGETYQTDGIERLYEANLETKEFYVNKVPKYGTSESDVFGNITLGGDPGSKIMTKIFGCKVGDNHIYVPVRRISDNIPGLYDKIGGSFKFVASYYCDGAQRYLTTEDNQHITTENGEEILI